ncbi:MAG: STAS domain-containing protein [Opitutaceae bacterium]|nr:STAS domain-containing protein [Opitutaceae bacterium]
MSDPTKSAYLVDPRSDPVLIRIEGRGSFQNCGGLRDFIAAMTAEGRRRFVLDLQDCAAMDSTFLGVLAGAAITLRKFGPAGSLVVARASPRHVELMRGLGLHRLLTIAPPEAALPAAGGAMVLETKRPDELAGARLVLEAHENLVAADEKNRAKFQDVLSFLRSRLDKK